MCDPAAEGRISVSRGGGFTGLYTSYTIDRSGGVTEHESILGTSKVVRTFELDATNVDRWIRALADLGFFDIASDRPGNMTESFELSAFGRQRRLRWPMGTEAPPAIAALWREIWGAVTGGGDPTRP
jgi:hypothetical protein